MNEHHLATEQMERLSPTTPPTEQGDMMDVFREMTPAERAEEMEGKLEQFYKDNRCPATLPAWRDARCHGTVGHTGKHTAYATWRNRSDG